MINEVNATVVFDYTRCTFIDIDIKESVIEFCEAASITGIKVEHRFQNEQQKLNLFKNDHARIY